MTERRCAWALKTPLECAYHDCEWGVPKRDDATLFEFLLLESMQAGLSWRTILEKRDGFREAFYGFDPNKVAAMGEADVVRLMQNPGIIRNRAKIVSAARNARVFLDLQARHGSFAAYVWDFVDGTPIQNKWRTMTDVPAITPVSTALTKDLKAHGVSFFGPTTAYAFMQAVGMVNDHLIECFRHDEV